MEHMRTCPNGHPVSESAAFCHECGAMVVQPVEIDQTSVLAPVELPQPQPPRSNASLYVSIASAAVIVLGLIAIVWVLNSNSSGRQAAPADASISICGGTPTQRPMGITLACDTGDASVVKLTWSQWDGQSATGVGVYVVKGCTPDCSAAAGQIQATVVLSGVAASSSGPQFTQVTVTPQRGRPFSQRIALYRPGSRPTMPPGPPVPLGGQLCPAQPGGGPGARYGVIGHYTSCEFAEQVRLSYVGAGGHGQRMRVTATSQVTHETYRNIECRRGGAYVICVGGNHDTAQVFLGPF